MNRNEIIAACDVCTGDSIFSTRFGLNGRVKVPHAAQGSVALSMIDNRQDTVLRTDDTVTLTNRPE